ncbi:MliC family protein [Fusobacterium russii]|uniref:MliC family protein n=1 Tax=Fusobacterium russii TaxID=854 RepID=UPI0003A9F5ED|nr:MliC family protein [Fusobacterium russii]
MKKLTLMAILLSLALVACGEKKVEEVKENATQAVEQVKENASQAVEEAKDKTNETVAEVKENAAQVVEQAKEKANETVEQVKEKANETVAEVKEKAEKTMENVKDKANEAMASAKAAMADALKFKAADGAEYTLNVNGDDAVLKTSTGEEYKLKAAVSGSGERFADDKGNEIHFKGQSGVVNLNGKETTVELVK